MYEFLICELWDEETNKFESQQALTFQGFSLRKLCI